MDDNIEYLISKLEDTASQMIGRLQMVSYEELVSYVDERQDIINQLEMKLNVNPPDDRQRARISAIIDSDSAVRRKIELFKNEAADWLQQKERKKVQRNAYESVYQQPDSILLDQKK